MSLVAKPYTGAFVHFVRDDQPMCALKAVYLNLLTTASIKSTDTIRFTEAIACSISARRATSDLQRG